MEDRKNFVSLWDIIARPMKIIRQLFIMILAAVIGLMTASCDLADVEQGLINSTISSTVTENGKDEDKESGEEDGKEDENPDDGQEGNEDGSQEGNEDGSQEPTPEDPDDGTSEVPEVKNSEFVILFTNDFHSQIEPTDDGKGGVLRLKALVDSVRTAEPYVLMADAGDLVQGTYYFSLFNGVVEMKMLDALGYDIRTIGNHEFDKKMTGLGEMFALSKVPAVASNYDFTATSLSQYVRPTRMVNAGGIKVGFIGLNVRLLNLVDPKACEGVVWQDAVNVADTYAEQLRDQGADIVIALSHLGYEAGSSSDYYDRGIVQRTRHIDMIIGGHSHTTLRRADYVTDLDGDQVPVVQTGSRGAYLGYAKIKLDENGKPSFEYRLIPVNSRLDNRVDPAFSDIIDSYAAEVEEKMNEKIAYSPYNITRSGTLQSRLGNLTADGLVWMAKEYFDVDADVGISNSGGIRANISQGDVTLGDVYAVYPFDNVLSVVDMKGSDLKEMFNAVAAGGLPISGGVRMVVTGNGGVRSVTVNGKAIVDSQTYKVATIDYLVNLGRYGLQNATNRRDGVDYVRDLYAEYFRYLADQNNGELSGPYDDRIVSE